MKTAFRLIVTSLLLAVSNLSGATHYVSLESTNPTPPYTNWVTAATNIQQAVDAASSGDAVVVANGLYALGATETETSSNNGLSVGFSRVAITNIVAVRSANGPQFALIDGGGTNRCVWLSDGASLSGFTLTNGYCYGGDGAGVWCASTEASLTNCVIVGSLVSPDTNWNGGFGGGARGATLYNCTLSDNSAYGGGGAADSTLNNCTLTRNSAGYGGGASGSTLNSCTLSGNWASWGGEGAGGGVYVCTLNNCTLTGNSVLGEPAASGGGAAFSTLSNCTLTGNSAAYGGGVCGGALNNCKLTGNSARSYGGGVYGHRVNPIMMNNCILTGNSATNGGGACGGTLNNCTLTGNSAWLAGGVLGNSSYPCTVDNCIVYYNTADIAPNYYLAYDSALERCCTIPVPTNSVGNITNEPAFVAYSTGNLRLRFDSPCINAGDNAYVITATDLDGHPRIAGGTVDLGAYEFQFSPQQAIISPSQTAEAGSNLRLQVAADGYPPLVYQWFCNGSNVLAFTDSGLLLTNLQLSQAGAYVVVLTNLYGALTSAQALLNVIPAVERRAVPAIGWADGTGSFLHLEYADRLNTAGWSSLSIMAQSAEPRLCFDLSEPLPAQRYYRAWQTNGPQPVLDTRMATEIPLVGTIGSIVRVDYINAIGPTDAWVTLDTVRLTNTSQLYFDISAWRQPQRLYRLVQVP